MGSPSASEAAMLVIDNPPGRNGYFNVGDDIQAIAAAALMPRIDRFIAKSDLERYDGQKALLIMNGWFGHEPIQWIPSAAIHPLILSFHISNYAFGRIIDSRRDFFKRHAPIGCRDTATLRLFEAQGIDAYHSSCLTLTLERSAYCDVSQPRTGIYCVDPLYKFDPNLSWRERLRTIHQGSLLQKYRQGRRVSNILQQVLSPDQIKEVQFLRHSIPLSSDDRAFRWSEAEKLLSKYANAKLVITSRIHCALPCLAFGTPVIFVDGALNHSSERARLDGIIDLMTRLEFDAKTGVLTDESSRPVNWRNIKVEVPDITAIRSALIAKVRDFLDVDSRQFC